MLFAISCIDKSGHADVRAGNRDDHLTYLKRHGDQVVVAGPYVGDDGKSMVGSLLVMDFPDKRAAEAFCQNDPYNKAGLFERVTIRAWKQVLPAA